MWVGLWDAMAFVLVVAWAGGIHFGPASRDFAAPKEISLAAVVLLVGLAGALKVWANVSVTEGLVFRAGSRLFHAWSHAIDRAPARVLSVSTALVAIVWAWASLRRHWALGSNSFDLGIYANALWNLTHGHGYVSSLKDGMNLFADHQTPTYWLIAPLFRLWPAPELMVIVQAIAYAASGAALYLLATQYGGQRWWAAALPLLFWNYLPTRNANAFDARPDSFLVPLFFWSIVGLQSRRVAARAAGGIAFLLALGCKETAALIGLTIGLAWLFGAGPVETRAFSRRAGLALAALSAIVFYVDVKIVPGVLGTSYAYANLYSHYGPTLADLLLAPVTQPSHVWQQLTYPAALSYLFWTLAPLAWIPLVDWCAWLVSGPAYLALFLANTPYRLNIEFQYSNEIVIGLFWAIARVMPRLAMLPQRSLQVWVAAWALAAGGGSEVLRLQHYAPNGHTRWVLQRLVPAVDPAARLAASDAFVPHMSTRLWVRHLRQVPDAATGSLDCIITDPSVSNRQMTNDEIAAIETAALSSGYRLELACGAVKVFSRPERACLVREVPCF